MKSNKFLSSIPLIKLGLASAIAVAAFGMTGCGGSSDSKSNTAAEVAIDPCLSADCTASGFVLPANAIYVSPDAEDGTDLKDAQRRLWFVSSI